MIKQSSWIGVSDDFGEICPEFIKNFLADEDIDSAFLYVTATGVYEAHINGKRVGNFIFAPGCTVYNKRHQYQKYDVKDFIRENNTLTVTLGKGWYRGRINKSNPPVFNTPGAVIALLHIGYRNGAESYIVSDKSWRVRKSNILFSDFYDGEIYDASVNDTRLYDAVELDCIEKSNLIPNESVYVTEHERLKPVKKIKTPKGEIVLDFGQNMAGYIEFATIASKGDCVKLSFAETLGNDGNFYNKNYRTAKSVIEYTCHDGFNIYKPHFTFFGFRYVRIDCYPGDVDPDDFTAVTIYSDMRRTGFVECGDDRLNRFFSNVIWGQKSNFIDVPMDCPQRDERQPWTGDAQIFAKTAAYNYDVKAFFEKWVRDLSADQFENGAIPDKSPNTYTVGRLNMGSAAWGDAITIVPWTMYLMYGDKKVLKDTFSAMKRWVDYITDDTLDEYLWTCLPEQKKLWGHHYGDWLAPDTPDGGFKGLTDDDIVASAFYAYSTEITVKTGKVLGENVEKYERLLENIIKTYKKRFSKPKTQTDHVLALHFNLTDDKKGVAKSLAEKIWSNGMKLQTGFVGTPYLLYALSDNGYSKMAYDLLLSEECPSWLYEVKHGATTVWEHWDAITEDGKISTSSNGMDSFNHYAFGSVMDWVYSVAAGIRPDENYPGFERVIIEPVTDKRLKRLFASLDIRYGTILSKWEYDGDSVKYEIEVPVRAKIRINGREYDVEPGKYKF